MFPALLALALLPSPADGPTVDASKLVQVPGPVAPVYQDSVSSSTKEPDLMVLSRHRARTLNVPTLAIPSIPVTVEDKIGEIAGWKAYRVEAPPKGVVNARLHSANEGRFRVYTMNRWGGQEQGMVRAHFPAGVPGATYTNPKAEKSTVFFLVDTTRMEATSEPFNLEFSLE
jgi:hypothetical protein